MSKRLNCSLNTPKRRQEISPKTKKPPSDATCQKCRADTTRCTFSPLLLMSFKRCSDETVDPRRGFPPTGLYLPLTASGSTRSTFMNKKGLTSQVLSRRQRLNHDLNWYFYNSPRIGVLNFAYFQLDNRGRIDCFSRCGQF